MAERMVEDILGQPESLAHAAERQLGAGLSALQEAAKAMKGARSLVLSGMGSSAYACISLGCRTGATVVESGELLHFPRRADVVVLVSRSGETVEVVKLLPLLRAQGTTVIGVTNEAESTLARGADIPVLVDCFADGLVAIQSYTGTLLTMLLLGAVVAGDSLVEWKRRVDVLTAAMRVRLPELLEESAGWREFYGSAPVMYLLGRGPSYGSALEGSLMFHESAKLPAVAMTGGNFRHGSAEVIDDKFRAIVFASQPATHALDAALAGDIARFGGRVQFIEAPEVHPSLAPVMEIAPVQVAAWRLTQWKSIPSGVFRFCTQVTTAE